MRKSKIVKPQMTIIIDNREGLPVLIDKGGDPNFPNLKYEFGTLHTGDYSIKGMSDPALHEYSVTIERKSMIDLFGSTGNERVRLQKEFIRMEAFDYAELALEGDLREMIKNPPMQSDMDPRKVYRTLIAWCQRHNVQFWPCPNRAFLEKHIFLSLQRFFDDRQEPKGKMRFSKL